ncbi:MAG: V-type ATP synthase subunit F [Hydrogenoanaerobacterium sp.]
MKFYVISDNIDTYMGMRLAGIEGVVVHTQDEVAAELAKAVEARDIGIILITDKLMRLCQKTIYEMKLKNKRPLIVEIPDRHGGGHIAEALQHYVSEAVGIKM